MIFGFTKLRIFDKIEPGQEFDVSNYMKASQMNSIEIRFLIRYEVDNQMGDENQKQSLMSKYRFTRLIYNMDSTLAFTLKRHVHLSTKKANEHIINIQIVD